jgi:hypothetical protein
VIELNQAGRTGIRFVYPSKSVMASGTVAAFPLPTQQALLLSLRISFFVLLAGLICFLNVNWQTVIISYCLLVVQGVHLLWIRYIAREKLRFNANKSLTITKASRRVNTAFSLYEGSLYLIFATLLRGDPTKSPFLATCIFLLVGMSVYLSLTNRLRQPKAE